MKIGKPYTITESEKNRIRGLHLGLKSIIQEQTVCEECGGVHEGACGGDMYEGTGMMCETCGKVHEGACGGMYEDELDEEMLTDLNGGTYEIAEMTPGLPKGWKMGEVSETNVPDGWKMVSKTDIQEQKYMEDIYDVWFGNETDDVISEERQTIYQLPKRFGNKRLTETALINMINNIIK
tara:strand:- start:3635 stop:4174 length:540 start_codon:yes stop_codon:yes gene_type:complete